MFQPKDSCVISALASDIDECHVTLLIKDLFYISHLWANSEEKNVQIFVGTIQKSLLIEFK